MFISDEQLEERLNSPRNLANRFKRGKLVGDDRPTFSTEHQKLPDQLLEKYETEEFKAAQQIEDTIQHREIKRPGNNRPWLSSEERTQIAIEANDNETQTAIALRHGVQVSTVSDIVNNARRVPNSERAVDQGQIDRQLDKIREAAIDRLMSGLGQLTDDKISAHTAKDISTICSNMARVVQQTIPQEKGTQQINLIVYTPELRQEKVFDSVEI